MTTGTTIACRARWIAGPISTDDIIPGRYKHMYTDPRQLAGHVFENRAPGFAATLAAGDALCCSEIFGIGSSREQAVSSLIAAGVVAVLAPRFGRIFFRNCWNLGLLPLETSPDAFAEGESLTIDLLAGRIQASGASRPFNRVPDEMLEMRRHGGLLGLIKSRRGDPAQPADGSG